MCDHKSSERTPLLRNTSNKAGHGLVIQDEDIEEAEVAGQGSLGPSQFPELGRRRSYSHSHWLAPDEDVAALAEPEDPGEFGADGLLTGVTRTQFRFVFGGILLGYFVSLFKIALGLGYQLLLTQFGSCSDSLVDSHV